MFSRSQNDLPGLIPVLGGPGIHLEKRLGAIYEIYLVWYDVNSSLHGNI